MRRMPEEPPTPDPILEAALAPWLDRPLFFVNVGASDGVSNDPLYPFILKYGWRGLLVEAVPHVFELLEKNYAGLGGMLFENVLVSDQSIPFHHLPEAYCRERPWARQIGSMDLERVRWALTYIAKEGIFPGAAFEDLQRITSSDLPAATLPSILARHDVQRFDVLNLDAEGADLDILQSLDLERYGVRAAIVETRPHFHDDAVARWLGERGFERVARIDWITDAFVRVVP